MSTFPSHHKQKFTYYHYMICHNVMARKTSNEIYPTVEADCMLKLLILEERPHKKYVFLVLRTVQLIPNMMKGREQVFNI